jgi:iron complex outermembrane receptor protein
MNDQLQGKWRLAVNRLLISGGLVFLNSVPADCAGTEANLSGQSSQDLTEWSLEKLLDTKVTSVSKKEERLSEAPAAIHVISQQDIRRSGVMSIPEALRLAPNLHAAQVDSSQWAIGARGFNSYVANKLLVLIDGRSVYTPLYAGVFWDVQDTLLEDIDRIEVISGPGATLWGANAVNGVINVITKSAKETQGALLLGGGGTEWRGFGGVRYGGQLASNVHYRVYAKYFDHASTVLTNGSSANNPWSKGQGGFRVDWDLSENDLVTFQGDIYDGRMDRPYVGTQFGDNSKITGGNLIGRWSKAFSQDSDLKLQFYHDRTRRRFTAGFDEDLSTYDLEFQHRFPVGQRNDIVWGANYRLHEDNVEGSALLAFAPPELSRQLFSAFAQDEIELVENRLHLTLGSKFEHNDYTGFEVQPSARLAWRLSERQTVWSAVSRAVRTPSRFDTDLRIPGAPPHLLTGNSDFVSEELLAYELGYRVRPSDKLSLSLSVFYNDYDDLRSFEPTSPFTYVFANGLEGRTYGAEISGVYQVRDWWRLQAGYAFLEKDLVRKSGSLDPTQGTGEANDPDHQFSLHSSMDLPGNLELDAGFRYVDSLPLPVVPSYVELDVRLAWRPARNVELSVVGQNLLDNHHTEFRPGTEIQRSVYGKVTWRF